MKTVFAFAAALSAMTAASAYAVPKALPASQPAVVSAAVGLDQQVKAQASDSVDKKAVLVAENRREFGSSYQRY
jgi:hypothetical protein